ncbi:MAG: hypothetical protein JWN85_811 [Gammaproteobacteria bacterium]|nr:hypothetical protein [Gammaproteobacteria bacterium]
MKRIQTVIGAAAAMLLGACGGSTDVAGIQGSGSPAPAAPAAAIGPITGFGSIFVNGVEYATAGARIMIDGQPGTEAQLQAGQVVTLEGSVNSDGSTGTATEVAFSGDAQGPATQIDLTANSFAVLGQTVRITGSTLFGEAMQPADLTGLQAGTVVEVSGFANAAGEIVASRVDLKAAASSLRVKGIIQGLDTTAHTFRINALIVDYSAATSADMLANGNVVAVQAASLTSAGELQATRIEAQPVVGATANQHADIDGIVTSYTSSENFILQGQQITTDANTKVVLHGSSLGVNVEVDVQGMFNAAGVLLAQKVEIRPNSASLLRGLVDSVTVATNTLSVLGVNVTTGGSTAFEDKSRQHLRPFGLADLRVGDYVEVHGRENPPGTLEAGTFERDNAENRSYLQGVVLNAAEPNLTVLGVTVVTTAQTHFAGAATSAANFFSQAAGRIVKARGTFSGGVLTADQVQLEK